MLLELVDELHNVDDPGDYCEIIVCRLRHPWVLLGCVLGVLERQLLAAAGQSVAEERVADLDQVAKLLLTNGCLDLHAEVVVFLDYLS